MKFLAAAAFAVLAFATPARAQDADPAVDFLGYCVTSGNSTNYCACLTDALAAAVTPKQLAIYTDYLKLLAGGERDEKKIIKSLKDKHQIKGAELGAALQAANTAATNAEQSCAGL